ncbi:MAG: outer membrane beta-barrel protein [Gemmatimonadetes bacterium]|nr:outer membrane beta-barrel protein [Gemmatimonadota bacterium]
MYGRTLVAASLLALTTATTAAAQARSTTQGLHLGLALNGSSIDLTDSRLEEDIEAESGAGLNFSIGYGFTPQLGILLTAAGANMNDAGDGYTLGQADIAGRFSFANPSRAFVPYIELGFAGLSLQDEFEGETLEFQGSGFTGAAGFNYFFSPQAALDLNFRFTKGEFNEFKFGDESESDDDGVKVNTGRVNLGLSFFPRGGR